MDHPWRKNVVVNYDNKMDNSHLFSVINVHSALDSDFHQQPHSFSNDIPFNQYDFNVQDDLDNDSVVSFRVIKRNTPLVLFFDNSLIFQVTKSWVLPFCNPFSGYGGNTFSLA